MCDRSKRCTKGPPGYASNTSRRMEKKDKWWFYFGAIFIDQKAKQSKAKAGSKDIRKEGKEGTQPLTIAKKVSFVFIEERGEERGFLQMLASFSRVAPWACSGLPRIASLVPGPNILSNM